MICEVLGCKTWPTVGRKPGEANRIIPVTGSVYSRNERAALPGLEEGTKWIDILWVAFVDVTFSLRSAQVLLIKIGRPDRRKHSSTF